MRSNELSSAYCSPHARDAPSEAAAILGYRDRKRTRDPLGYDLAVEHHEVPRSEVRPADNIISRHAVAPTLMPATNLLVAPIRGHEPEPRQQRKQPPHAVHGKSTRRQGKSKG